jgi:phage-related protein
MTLEEQIQEIESIINYQQCMISGLEKETEEYRSSLRVHIEKSDEIFKQIEDKTYTEIVDK